MHVVALIGGLRVLVHGLRLSLFIFKGVILVDILCWREKLLGAMLEYVVSLLVFDEVYPVDIEGMGWSLPRQ